MGQQEGGHSDSDVYWESGREDVEVESKVDWESGTKGTDIKIAKD